MENYVDGPEIPMGLGMALAQNAQAMRRFAALSKQEQQQVIAQTHTIRSKQEMRQFVHDRFGE